MTGFASAERAALADLLAAVGPDAPTLCEGWQTRDLAAHLVVRGRRPDVAGGIFLSALAGPLKRVQDSVARRPWDALVASVRRRPVWSIGPLDEMANREEYFVHHEDVRRAQPGWQPRSLSAGHSAALWSGLRRRSRLALRRTPAAVTIAAPEHGAITAGRGGPAVTLSGEPQELVLFLFGRQSHARASIVGSDELVNRLRTSRFGP
jgi:uncharacterized protein (TIGR03085 family)